MFARTNLLAMATLGLGTLLGYAAAGGQLPFAKDALAKGVQEAPLASACSSQNQEAPGCCSLPGPEAFFTSTGAGGGQGEQFKMPKADNPRGATTGPTAAPGHDHPNEYMFTKPTEIAKNMEPVIVHPKQVEEAKAKLTKAAQKFGRKPNFLVFLMDDVGWMDPGFNGGGVTVGNATPNMDKIAHQGKILRSAYSTPSCSPSRASIMTGQNPLHHGILRPPMYNEPGGLDGMATLASILQQLGYYCQGIGKWHMGENEGSLPQNVGFDDYYGFLGVSDMYTEWRDVYFNPEVALSPTRFKAMEKLGFNHNNVHCVKGQKNPQDTYLIDLRTIMDLDQDWAAYGEKFLRDNARKEKPWFLYYCTRGCHFDNYPNHKYAGKSQARTVFSDAMVEVDDIFGRLVKTLEETGQLDNTIIILTSDNGPEQEIPPHGRSPWRGGKGSCWEGGVRVPTFVYWKDMVQPGPSDGIFDQIDILPTFVGMAGAPGEALNKFLPADRYTDGIDQTSFFLATDGESCRRSRIYTLNQFYAMTRIDEFQYIFTAEIEGAFFKRGDVGGFSGSVVTNTGGAIAINLYTNPQQDVSVGVRHIPICVPLMAETGRYFDVLKKYPPKFKVGFQGN
jgi:arylsulfatase A-like enzyme